MYHDIKKNEYKKFEDQINIIKNDGWKFLHPNELLNLSINKKKIKGKNIILTFDDGFYSNSIIEKKILTKYKIKAAFFIPYNFMKSKNKKEALKFIKKRLKIFDYKAEKDERINMNLNDILILSKKKHVIGFHTRNVRRGNPFDQTHSNGTHSYCGILQSVRTSCVSTGIGTDTCLDRSHDCDSNRIAQTLSGK